MTKSTMRIMTVDFEPEMLNEIDELIGPNTLHPNRSEFIRYAINWFLKMIIYQCEKGELKYDVKFVLKPDQFTSEIERDITLCKFKELKL